MKKISEKVEEDKELNNIKNLAIDLGASSIKMAGIIGDDIKVDKIKSLATNYGKDNKNTVILENSKYHFGVGEPLIVRDKTQRRLLPESILLAYYKIYGKTLKPQLINLAIGVPINIYLADSKLKAFEKSINELKNLIIDGKVNSETVTLKINEIKVCAEGYSAFGAIAEDIDENNNNVIVDIGYKTSDVIALEKVNEEWNITANFTIAKGMWDIFVEIEKALFDLGIELSPEQIEQRLLNAPVFSIGNKPIDLKKLLVKGESVANYIYNQLDLQISGLNTSSIYLIGGGSIFFNIILNDRYPNIVLIDDIKKLVYANVIGYLQQLDED